MTSLHLHLLKGHPTPVHVPDLEERKERDRGDAGVRCPQCGWEPSADDRWACSCLHLWNTFQTRGVCPACEKQWLETQCPRCNEWSLHEHWYYSSPDAED